MMIRSGIVISRFLVALAAGIFLPRAFAQEPPTDIQGPTYTFEKIRNKDIAGIRLSLTPEQATRKLQDAGWQGYVHEDRAYLTKGSESIWLQTPKVEGASRITYFSYTKHLSEAEAIDVQRRRAEMTELLGTPTIWTKWVYNDQTNLLVIGDRFYFAPDREQEAREEARSCGFDWQCRAIEKDEDCRPAVRSLREGTIEGGFGYRSLHVTVRDDGLLATEAFQDRFFRDRDLSQAICVHPSVH